MRLSQDLVESIMRKECVKIALPARHLRRFFLYAFLMREAVNLT